MKACLILLALVAAAYAESDPYWYGGYGYGYPYGYGLGLKSAPCVNAHNVPVPCAGRRKREAEADAKPDPFYLYGGVYPYGLATYPVVAGVPCTNNAGLAVPCALGHPLIKTAAVATAAVAPAAVAERRKREADADAKPDPFYVYGGVYPHGLVAPVVYGTPCTNVDGQAVPCALGHPQIKTAAVATVAIAGRRKREAEADPQLVYGYPWTYAAPVATTYEVPTITGTEVEKIPCVNVDGEPVDCALGPVDAKATLIKPKIENVKVAAYAHHPFLFGRKKREADPLYLVNLKTEVKEHKVDVPAVTYTAAWPYGVIPVAATTKLTYNTVHAEPAPLAAPSNPDAPTLVHSSQHPTHPFCTNGYGAIVPC